MSKRVFKPGRKLGGGTKMYRKWEEYDMGDIVIGRYSDNHIDQYGKKCYVLEVYDAEFKDKTGKKYLEKNLVLNACGMLSKAMDKASIGDIVQITYNGQSTIEKGPFAGKESHLIETQVMDEDSSEADPEL